MKLVNHPSLIPSYKLIVIQWTQYYQQVQEVYDRELGSLRLVRLVNHPSFLPSYTVDTVLPTITGCK